MKKHLLLFTFILITVFGYSQSRMFTGKPMYEILTKRLGDTLGITNVELFPTIAPFHVNNFDSLVTYQYYDSTAFHRVIPGFMIQGGDPRGNGLGGPGYTLPPEFSKRHHQLGTLSMASIPDQKNQTGQLLNPEKRSGGSQFLLMLGDAGHTNG